MGEHKCMYRDQWESVNKSRSHWVQQAEKMEAEIESLNRIVEGAAKCNERQSCEGKLKDAVIEALLAAKEKQKMYEPIDAVENWFYVERALAALVSEGREQKITGIDLAVPGSDRTAWTCRYCKEIMETELAVMRHKCSTSEERAPDTCPECHGTGKTVIRKEIGVEDCPECGRDSEEREPIRDAACLDAGCDIDGKEPHKPWCPNASEGLAQDDGEGQAAALSEIDR